MAKGIALTIGLNSVDPGHYAGWSGPLVACEADATDMAETASAAGFEGIKTILTRNANRKAVLDAIGDAAGILKPGDIFMLSYSGHGGQLPDKNNDEDDAEDETWCLYDGELVDDEIYAALGAIKSGVRVLMFSDSCHSGSVARAALIAASHGVPTREHGPAVRAIPPHIALRTYRMHRDLYDPILSDTSTRNASQSISASVLLISGCQDNQLSLDGAFNGLFTGTLLQVWNDGKFKGDYRKFHRKIVERMPERQTPNYFWAGTPDVAFERTPVFKI